MKKGKNPIMHCVLNYTLAYGITMFILFIVVTPLMEHRGFIILHLAWWRIFIIALISLIFGSVMGAIMCNYRNKKEKRSKKNKRNF